MDSCPVTTKNEDWSYVLPFTRPLTLTSPEKFGQDVMILQNLLQRHQNKNLSVTGSFNKQTQTALQAFQKDMKLQSTNGVLDVESAALILNRLMSDGYKDDGAIPDGINFKMYIPVYRDRTIETTGIIYARDGTILHKFTTRTRGSSGDQGQVLNQLTTNGNTPTGLSYMDINTKELDDKKFGPYPVLRVVKGIQGNSAIGRDNYTAVDGRDTFLSDYRTGILVHTGEWENWKKGEPMPNSNGCIHVSPEDQKIIIDLLVNKCDCHVNENTFGKLPYPYKTQGIVSIEQLD